MTLEEKSQRVAELVNELLGLKERTLVVRKELSELAAALAAEAGEDTPTVAVATRRQPQARTPKAKTITVVGRTGEKGADLPTLLTQIAASSPKPLKIADFVSAVRATGYQSEAEDFPNMVYQALLKLCKRGVLEKDKDSRDYHYVGKAA
jgi:hypothetical protein